MVGRYKRIFLSVVMNLDTSAQRNKININAVRREGVGWLRACPYVHQHIQMLRLSQVPGSQS
jgi:hypothetical protein